MNLIKTRIFDCIVVPRNSGGICPSPLVELYRMVLGIIFAIAIADYERGLGGLVSLTMPGITCADRETV
jgi:hypothetical protein